MSDELWLVRTSENTIAGPYTSDKIVELIANEHLYSEDEICRANEDWFYLYQTDEIEKQLGIKVILRSRTNEDHEKTEEEITETRTQRANLDPIVEVDSSESDDLPEMTEPDQSSSDPGLDESRSFREIKPVHETETEDENDPPAIRTDQSKAERPKLFQSSTLWKIIAWLLLVIGGAFLLIFLKKLRG